MTPAVQKGADHSTAGAKDAVCAYGDKLGRLVAFGIAGHHAGLMGSGHEAGNLRDRLLKRVENYDGWRDHAGELPRMDLLTPGLMRLKGARAGRIPHRPARAAGELRQAAGGLP